MIASFPAAKRRLARKHFLQALGLAAAGFFLTGRRAGAQSTPAGQVTGAPDRLPQIEADLIRRFVIAGHANLDLVQQMLREQPALINATWDWGGGDYETALGGASHMGRRDIAELLLANGARIDLFAAAALGRIEIIKAAVAAYPDIVHVRGPHTITLLMHAQKGGSTEVVDFLKPLV